MNKKKREEILKYIYDRYTGQEIIEALQTECPNAIKELHVKDKSFKAQVVPKRRKK
jgi:hypothetical protein